MSLQGTPSELDLLDDLEKMQTKSKEEKVDQKESNELQSREDFQKLSVETCIQEENVVEINDVKSTIDEELTYDNEIFGHIFTKIQAYIDKSKEENSETNILNDECQIFNDFFNLMEKHETNLTNENLSVIRERFKLFFQTVYNIDLCHLFTIQTTSAKKEIFYLYFNLINLPIIQNYLQNLPIPDQLQTVYGLNISRIFDVMRTVSRLIDLSLHDFRRPINCIQLLSIMLNYVKTDLNSSDLTLDPSFIDASITRYSILGFICTYSNKTVMVPDLIEADCAEIMINGLPIISKTVDADYELKSQSLIIIYNISRHDDGVERLNTLNAIDIIKEFQDSSEGIYLQTLCSMVLALLSTSEQITNDRKNMNNVLDTLLEMIYKASVSSNYVDDGFHISEPLIVFVKLFNDDRTLYYIMEYSKVDLDSLSTVDFLINLLIMYHSTASNEDPLKQTTCTALVNILWSISFQEKYKKKLKNASTEFRTLIHNLTREPVENTAPDQYLSKYIEKIQKSAEGLLINIDDLTNPATEKAYGTSTLTENHSKRMIMISYSHGDADFCKQLYNELLKKGYDIWIDFKFLKTGDLWEKIAIGMKQANLIICLMSENYYESKSCRLEATYALDKLQTTRLVIPVFLRKHELPEWLEIRTSVLKYVRFRDIKQLEDDKLFELLDMIENSLPPAALRTSLNSHPPILSTHLEQVSIPMPTTNEVPLQSNNIPSAHHDQSAQRKPTVTKLEKQDISSKSNLVPCSTIDESLYPEKPVEEWNQNDISQWFQHNEIITELRDLCHFKDGHDLLDYATIFLDTKKLQYQMYCEEFSRSDGITFGEKPLLLHQFTKFSNAVRKLKKLKRSE